MQTNWAQKRASLQWIIVDDLNQADADEDDEAAIEVHAQHAIRLRHILQRSEEVNKRPNEPSQKPRNKTDERKLCQFMPFHTYFLLNRWLLEGQQNRFAVLRSQSINTPRINCSHQIIVDFVLGIFRVIAIGESESGRIHLRGLSVAHHAHLLRYIAVHRCWLMCSFILQTRVQRWASAKTCVRWRESRNGFNGSEAIHIKSELPKKGIRDK